MQSQNFQLEEFVISEAIGLALHDADFGVGSLQWPGGDVIVIVIQNLVPVRGKGEEERLRLAVVEVGFFCEKR